MSGRHHTRQQHGLVATTWDPVKLRVLAPSVSVHEEAGDSAEKITSLPEGTIVESTHEAASVTSPQTVRTTSMGPDASPVGDATTIASAPYEATVRDPSAVEKRLSPSTRKLTT